MESEEVKVSKFIFPNGRPVKPDVDKLMEKWPRLVAGDGIEYEKINAVLGIKNDTFRWKTIVNAWRKRLQNEQNVLLQAFDGKWFLVMNGSERIEHSFKRTKQAAKNIRKAGHIAATTPDEELSKDDKIRKAHTVKLAAAYEGMFLTSKKEIKFEIGTVKPV